MFAARVFRGQARHNSVSTLEGHSGLAQSYGLDHGYRKDVHYLLAHVSRLSPSAILDSKLLRCAPEPFADLIFIKASDWWFQRLEESESCCEGQEEGGQGI